MNKTVNIIGKAILILLLLGLIKYGILDRTSKEYHSDGTVSETSHSYGFKHGVETVYHSNGKIKLQRPYVYGKITGVEKEYNDSGQLIRKTTLVEGVKHGIKESLGVKTPYVNGIKNGVEKQYSRSMVVRETPFVNGQKEGMERRWNEASGKIKEETLYVNGKPEGIVKRYHKSGKIMEEISYKNGKKHGLEKRYFESGRVKKETVYENGKIVSDEVITYYESGNVRFVQYYKDYKRHGKFKSYAEDGSLLSEEDHDVGRQTSGTRYYTSGKVGKFSFDAEGDRKTSRWFDASERLFVEVLHGETADDTELKFYDHEPIEIPEAVNELLEKKYPGWELFKVEKYNIISGLHFYGEYYGRGILIGDFDGNGKTDHAIQVEYPDGARKQRTVAVFLNDGTGYRDYDLDTNGDIITLSKKGSTIYPAYEDDEDGQEPVYLTGDAINVMWLERASTAYYFKDGAFLSVTTGD